MTSVICFVSVAGYPDVRSAVLMQCSCLRSQSTATATWFGTGPAGTAKRKSRLDDAKEILEKQQLQRAWYSKVRFMIKIEFVSLMETHGQSELEFVHSRPGSSFPVVLHFSMLQ
jgi:hypothetical protein